MSNPSVRKVAIGDIHGREGYPEICNEAEIRQMKQSIEAYGLLQPLVVTPRECGGYSLACGYLRLAALKALGRSEVEVRVIEDVSALDVLVFSWVENMDRKDFSYLDQADTLRLIKTEGALTVEELAERVGISVGQASKLLALDYLPEPVRDMVEKGWLAFSKAYVLTRIPHLPQEQHRLARLYRRLPRRELEREVNELLGKHPLRPKTSRIETDEGVSIHYPAGMDHAKLASIILREARLSS